MAVRWLTLLRADPIAWLLEPENPAIRYWTLLDLLDTPGDSPDVQSAWAMIASYPPVAGVLAAQKRDGHWVKRDYYLPKHHGTFWTLSVLADVGLTAGNEQISRSSCSCPRRCCRLRSVDGATHRPLPCRHSMDSPGLPLLRLQPHQHLGRPDTARLRARSSSSRTRLGLPCQPARNRRRLVSGSGPPAAALRCRPTRQAQQVADLGRSARYQAAL